MAKFGCTCGSTISLNSIPEFNEAVLITDIALDNAVGRKVTTRQLPKRIVYECWKCGRLWIQTEPKSDEWISFSPDGDFLKFRDDYDKSFDEEPYDPEEDDEEPFDVKPEEITLRRCAVSLVATINAGYRGFVATHPLEYDFKFDRAIVPENTPDEILLHHQNLLDATPINLAFSAESGRLGLQRALFKPYYKKGEKVEIEVENTTNADFVLRVGVMGVVRNADLPPDMPGRH